MAFIQSHCMKSVQIQSFLWSLFSCIWTEYRKIKPEKTPYLDTLHVVSNIHLPHFNLVLHFI